jgi:lipid-A-disaccharide synthase
MKPKQIMVIAGEASGDSLAADLVSALRRELTEREIVYTAESQPLRTGLEPRFFGAGGHRMKAAGVELAFDLTAHSVIGISDSVKNYFKLRGFFNQLLTLAIERQPDVIVGVDYGYFNLSFGAAIRKYVRSRRDQFHDWRPKLVQYVSPQVWASREHRAWKIARDYDLLLSIFPFEKAWYACRVPGLRVEFVGHPVFDRGPRPVSDHRDVSPTPSVLLLPGSRRSELHRHVPVMLNAVRLINRSLPKATFRIVLPNETLLNTLWHEIASCTGLPTQGSRPATLTDVQQCAAKFLPSLTAQIGNLSSALAETDLAIASTGTVTVECAWHGVPTVTLYKTSWTSYQIARRLVKVKWLTMPNLLAGKEVYPEFVQNAATPEKISCAALELLENAPRRAQIIADLEKIVSSLGPAGASQRAAHAIASLLAPAPSA